MTTSGDKVSNTPELLEMILLHLLNIQTANLQRITALRALLGMQRVSKAFQGTIKGSTKLQEALSFRQTSQQSTVGTPLSLPPSLSVKANGILNLRRLPLGNGDETVYFLFQNAGARKLTVWHKRPYLRTVGSTVPEVVESWKDMFFQRPVQQCTAT